MQLFNRKDVSEILKCSVSKVIQLEEHGKLIPVRLPATGKDTKSTRTLVMYDSKDVQTFIDSCKDYS